MACNTFNFSKDTCTEVEIGSNFRLSMLMEDSEGSPIDLTGRDITLTIKDVNDETFEDIILSEVSDSSTTGLNYESIDQGIIVIQILSGTTSTLSRKTYVYEMVDNTEHVTLMLGGIQVIEGEF